MSKKRQTEDQGNDFKRKRLLTEVAKGNLQFSKPDHPNFNSLMKEQYFNFTHEPSSSIPQSLQTELSCALNILHNHGYFYRDWVKVKGQTFQTPVSRTLIGQPGLTYKYLGLRLFTIPWSYTDRQPENEVEVACRSIGKLNEHYKTVSRRLLLDKITEKTKTRDLIKQSYQSNCSTEESREHSDEIKDEIGQGPSIDDSTNFNVALINYMDPNDAELRLKPEPYYGMGPQAVSWHMDSNLVPGSTVAVYNHTCTDEDDSICLCDWMVGLKVSWDIETAGVAIPLRSGESYFMLGDLNDTHQHCVIAGSQARYSSTHRVAECSEGTLAYIQQRCTEALTNLIEMENGQCGLKSLHTECLEFTETVHNEVEFEWLRQFWMQGSQHAAERKIWIPAMENLEKDWNKMEQMTKLAIDEVNCGSENIGATAEVLIVHLKERQKMRQDCLKKFSPRLLDTMHPNFLPIHRPSWEDDDPSQPLPFDLSDIISKMSLMCKRQRTSVCDSESPSP